MTHPIYSISALFVFTWILISCSRVPLGGGNKNIEIECPDGSMRVQVNCTSVTSLKERVANANLGIPKWGLGFGGTYEERAWGQIEESTQHLAVSLESKCRQYNACAISLYEWSAAETQIFKQLNRHVVLAENLEENKANAQIGDALFSNAVPEQADSRIRLNYSLEMKGDNGTYSSHVSGEPMISGSEFRINIQLNKQAFVYILLLSSQGRSQVIFPMRGIQQRNPVQGNTIVYIPDPGSGTFSLDNAVGTEHLQIVISSEPLGDLQRRLTQMQTGDYETTIKDDTLHAIGKMLCDGRKDEQTRGINLKPSAVDCDGVTTRGILIKPPLTPNNMETELLVARPYDNLLVRQHKIQHVARL